MLNQRGHLDNPQDPDYLLYVSLLLLGLDPAALEHKLKTPVNQKCFFRINKKLGDTILHFLFVCLDREKAGKVFRDCWPLLDKKHESQFYKAAFEWYKTLQQNYKQPVPTVMTKTFMAPGGPRFTSTLMTLSRTALHTLITKRAPSCTLLNTPNQSRILEQNWQTLRTLQAFKVAHSQNYILQQKIREKVLVILKNKARELSSKYRRLCKEGERAGVEFIKALNSNERLAQHQKDIFTSASSGTIQKAVFGDISRINDSVRKLWMKVDQYQEVEESAWKVLSPLLDGSTSLSHINGSVYSPEVPDIVLKRHANAINKLNLQGLYCEGKLDVLSLVQYSTLALTSLLDTSCNTHNDAHTESSDKIIAQLGQVTSLGETVNQLSDKLSTLVPGYNHSFSSSILKASSLLTMERIGLAGKPQLCPPTPPFILMNKPLPLISATHVPLQLTPGVQQPSPRLANDCFTATPRRFFCDIGMISASKKSPKANVMYRAITSKADSIKVNESIKKDILEADLSMDMATVDLREQYQKKKKRALLSDGNKIYQKQKGVGLSPSKKYFTKKIIEKQVNGPLKVLHVPMHQDMKELDQTEKRDDCMKCNIDVIDSDDNSYIDKLTNGITEELFKCDDGGIKEMLSSHPWNEREDYAPKSGCAGMPKDSDTLSDAIQDMNIMKKWGKFDRNRDCPPHIDFQTYCRHSTNQDNSHKLILPIDKPNKQNIPQSGQHSHPDITIIPKLFGGNNSLDGNTNDTSRIAFTNQEKVAEASPINDQRHSLNSQERMGSPLKFERRCKDSMPNLQERLHFVTQTPVKDDWPPVGTKIPSRFDGLDVSPGNRCFASKLASDIPYENSNISELKHHSKTRLNLLLELQESSQKYNALLLQESPQVTKSKPNFISYVENLKKSHSIDTSEKKTYKTERNNKQKASECIVPDNYANGWPTETVSMDYYENFTRMQNLLNLDEDTITSVNSKDEVFVSAEDASHQFETQRRHSSLLPEASVFDTLTDSILGGELDVSLLADKDVGKQIRRESLSSRRHSVANMRRFSLESTKYSSEALGFGPEDCYGILDENDHCLLSTSVEDA